LRKKKFPTFFNILRQSGGAMLKFFIIILWRASGQFDLLQTSPIRDWDQILQRQEEIEFQGVCVFLNTEIFADQWTLNYARKFIVWVRSVFLVSIKRQFKTTTQALKVFKLMINGTKGTNGDPKLAELYEYGNKSGEVPLFWYRSKHEWNAIIKETVLKHQCYWISTVWLDADDALLDDYFKYITEEIPKILSETRTRDGLPWRGSVFGLRSPKWLEMGLNRCTATFRNGPHHFGGYSQGQGLILKRSVWEELNQEFWPHTHHKHYLRHIREWVMHGLGHKDYKSKSGLGKYRQWRHSPAMINLDIREAAESGIQMINLSKNWTTSGLFVRTTFSSHFDWYDINYIPICTRERICKVNRLFPKDVSYIMRAWMKHKEIHVRLLEACNNNGFFFHTNKQLGESCEEIEQTWLQYHEYP